MITGTAYSILLFAIVITAGLWLGKFKVKGVSIGATWILFLGILLSHFGFVADEHIIHFMKDFGLILFVFSIGLQVGPGFFSSFKQGGVKMNVLAACTVLLSAVVAFVIHIVTGESLETMVGVMSGAVTNTPGLGAAQQTMSDVMSSNGETSSAISSATSSLASAYAVAYPIGVLGVLFLLIMFKSIFKIDLEKERKEIEKESGSDDNARRMHCQVVNPSLYGKTLYEALGELHGEIVVSRLMRNGVITSPDSHTELKEGDKLLIVTTQKHVDMARIIFGKEIPMTHNDWVKQDEHTVIKRVRITKPEITGKKLKSLNLRALYGVNVTRVVRAGIELVGTPDLTLQMGDALQVVGTEEGIQGAAKVIGNKPSTLNHPNLILLFAGIALGIVLGSLPIRFPGIPQPIKLGLAGGPLIIAILIGHFGPRLGISTYTTESANMMLREMGISFFLAAVGLGAGQSFVPALMAGGFWWILYGALITIIPILTIGLLARYVFKLNFYQICGLVSGSTTNPPVLAFAQGAYGAEYTSVNYATVYPLSMFLRVLVAQVMILIALA